MIHFTRRDKVNLVASPDKNMRTLGHSLALARWPNIICSYAKYTAHLDILNMLERIRRHTNGTYLTKIQKTLKTITI